MHWINCKFILSLATFCFQPLGIGLEQVVITTGICLLLKHIKHWR